MRNLKFRAWDSIDKKWLFGYDYKNLGGFSLFGEVVLMGQLSTISLERLNDVIVSQYSGINDENGKEIYEGDLLNGFTEIKCYEVIFEDGAFYLEYSLNKNKIRWGLLSRFFEVCEKYECKVVVIGNIHEDIELLNTDDATVA